jgi:hypothetical protein
LEERVEARLPQVQLDWGKWLPTSLAGYSAQDQEPLSARLSVKTFEIEMRANTQAAPIVAISGIICFLSLVSALPVASTMDMTVGNRALIFKSALTGFFLIGLPACWHWRGRQHYMVQPEFQRWLCWILLSGIAVVNAVSVGTFLNAYVGESKTSVIPAHVLDYHRSQRYHTEYIYIKAEGFPKTRLTLAPGEVSVLTNKSVIHLRVRSGSLGYPIIIGYSGDEKNLFQ